MHAWSAATKSDMYVQTCTCRHVRADWTTTVYRRRYLEHFLCPAHMHRPYESEQVCSSSVAELCRDEYMLYALLNSPSRSIEGYVHLIVLLYRTKTTLPDTRCSIESHVQICDLGATFVFATVARTGVKRIRFPN